MIHRIYSFLAIVIIFTSLSANAAGRRDFKSDVTVGGSISAPSTYLGLFTNPAALSQTAGLKFSLQAGADNVWDNPTYRGGLQGGIGFLGVGAFLDRQTRSGTDQSRAYGGLGIELSPLNLALGASIKKGMSGPYEGQDWTAGLIFSPTLWIQLGATAMSANEEFSEVGVGLAVVMIDGIQIVVDSAGDEGMGDIEFKPGIKFYNTFGGFSVSYGTGDRLQFTKGTSAGVFVRLGLNSQVEVAYNHGGMLPKYYGALTFGF